MDIAFEIFALIILAVIAIKLVVVLVSPKSWMKVVKVFFKRPILTEIVCLVLAIIVLYILMISLMLTEIFAVLLFLSLMCMATFACYAKESSAFAQKVLKNRKGLKKAWPIILYWVILIGLLIFEILA